MGLPGLPNKVVDKTLPTATKEEAALASGPGMYGRIWLGQSLAFDEAYQILQEHMQLPDAHIHSSMSCAHMPSVLHDRSHASVDCIDVYTRISSCVSTVTTGALCTRRPEVPHRAQDRRAVSECRLVQSLRTDRQV